MADQSLMPVEHSERWKHVMLKSPDGCGSFCVAISAVTRYNLDVLLNLLHAAVSALPAPEME